ncbi:MAG: CDP-alcohol phosphatidyltransferase family protein [Alphaproteobacteria bacterium]|nr:MAG: CDP-alcohol phosphatidyltransferase family protein [Alphaproteobacteria bacterium]
MLDRYVRPIIDPPLNAVALRLARTGVTANRVTGVGFILGLISFIFLAMQTYGLAFLFIALSRLADGLDGPLARVRHATDLGGFYDIVSDFVFYSGVVFFFAVGRPEVALPAAALIFAFVGTGSSFLAYGIFAAKCELSDDARGKKSFAYLGGITEGTESIGVLLAICLWPDAFEGIAWTFAVLCWLTTVGRVLQARQAFGGDL